MSEPVLEVSWRFDAGDLRPVVAWLDQQSGSAPLACAMRGSANVTDTYLDTPDARFARAGYALSVRRGAGRSPDIVASLKALAGRGALASPGGRAITERLTAGGDVLDAPGEVGARVRAVVGSSELMPKRRVRTRLTTYEVTRDGRVVAVLVLHAASIRTDDDRRSRARRVEVCAGGEQDEAVDAFIAAFASDCALQPARFSTDDVAALSGSPLEAHRADLGPLELDEDPRMATFALVMLRRQFHVVLDAEPGTRLGDDIEALHRMRVAIRRVRAALDLFGETLPAGLVACADDLRWIGGVLGDVRDLDVQIADLVAHRDTPELHALRLVLERRRAHARAVLLDALDTPRYERLVRRFVRLLATRRGSRSSPPAKAVLPEVIEHALDRVRRHGRRVGDDAAPEEYHALRRRCRRARYALEFASVIYPKKTRPLIKRLVTLQDVLGEQQDAQVAIEHLYELATGPDGLPALTLLEMGALAERRRMEMRDMGKRFASAYSGVTGKRAKQLRKSLDAERPSSPVPTPESPTTSR